MRLCLSLLLFVSFYFVNGQDAIIQLRDSVKLRTELISTSDTQLFTKAGTLGISEIYVVRFQAQSDIAINPRLINKLLASGIIVYAGGRKLDALAPQPVSVLTSQSSTIPPISNSPTVMDKKENQEKKNEESKKENEQDSEQLEDLPKGSLGIGFGQDYGGIGVRLTFLPDQHIGLYFSGGYAIAGFGYNAGAIIRINPEKRIVPTFNVMYGYTAAIAISGTKQYDKIYYGPSIGAGFISKTRRDERSFWHFELILPFRPAEFDRDLAALQNNPAIKGVQPPWPVTISIGYHFSF